MSCHGTISSNTINFASLFWTCEKKKNSLSHLMFMLYTCLDGQLSACLLSDGL